MTYAEDNGELVRDPLWFDDGFTMIPNSWARDSHLSNQARGLLVQIASHKAGFKVTVAQLVGSAMNGRDAINGQLRELVERGYLLRRDFKVGGLRRYRYHLRDPHAPVDSSGQAKWDLSTGSEQNPRSRQQTGFQGPGKPHPGKPLTENPHPKEDYLSYKETSVNETPNVPPVDNAAAGRSENAAFGAPHAGYALAATPQCPAKPQRYRDRRHSYLDSVSPVRGVFAAQEIKPQARTLAHDRGIRTLLLDYDAMRGLDDADSRLF